MRTSFNPASLGRSLEPPEQARARLWKGTDSSPGPDSSPVDHGGFLMREGDVF